MDLSQIRIEFPESPTRIWDHSPKTIFHDYRVLGYLDDGKVGHINVSVCQLMAGEEKNDFWFMKRKKLWTPRPVAVFQRTELDYRGQGVSGKLLVLVNEEVQKKYGLPLVSDTTFCSSPVADWKSRGFAERPAIRVWEKLEREGLASRCDYKNLPRWVMK